MSRGLLPWMLLGCVALVGFALAARGIGESAAPHARDSVPARKIVASSSEPAARHYVTPDQLAAASRDVAPTIVDFQAVAHDRGLRSLAELADGRPAILVFVKQGCPCSVQFQPVFNRLAEAFDGRMAVLGVIDGGIEVARAYAEANHVPYSILADHEGALIRQFDVKNAAYVALVGKDGALHTLWPGCSESMIAELCDQAGRLSACAAVTIACPEMPAPLTTGCPF